MTYAQKDKSLIQGEPFECYEIKTARDTWRYTSHNKKQTVGGFEYVPQFIQRSSIEISSDLSNEATTDITVDAKGPVALACAYNATPLKMVVKIIRAHEGTDLDTDFEVIWNGEFVSATTAGNLSTIKTRLLAVASTAGKLGSIVYKTSCNNTLFDERCGVDPALHTRESKVVAVRGQKITVVNSFYGSAGLNLGTLVNLRNVEKRVIISNLGNELTIDIPFDDIQPGDDVSMTRGCDLMRLGSCKQIYNNTARYVGFDFVAVNNPFITRQA